MPGPKERDLESSRAALRDWLGRKLRTRHLELSELTGPANTGFSSDTLLFEARTDDGRDPLGLVARLEPQGFNVFPDYDVSVQFRVMQALAPSDVPVPRMRWLEADASILGTPFYVMDRVDGEAPTDSPPYHVGGWVSELPPPDRARLWWNGLEALCRIHLLPWQELGLDFLADPADGADPLTQQLDYYERFFKWAVEEPARYPLVRRALTWLREHAPGGEPVSLCWGDSRLSNQMFRSGECVAVLDWEMVRLGNPVQDLAWWLAIDRCLSEGLGIPRLEGLPGKEETVSLWRERTGRSVDALPYYEVLAHLKFSVIMARIGRQMQHYEVLPADSDMDVNNLASVVLERALETSSR